MDCCRKTSTNSRAGDNRVVGRAGRRVARQSMQPAAGCSRYTVVTVQCVRVVSSALCVSCRLPMFLGTLPLLCPTSNSVIQYSIVGLSCV